MKIASLLGLSSAKRATTPSAIVVALAFLAFVPGAPASDRAALYAPPPLTAQSRGHVVPATLGTYCWSGPEAVACADSIYPLPIRRRLPVGPGDQVALRVGARAARVDVVTIRVAEPEVDYLDRIAARPITPTRSRWTTTLPNDLGGANALEVSVTYPKFRGDADFWVGLRPS